MATLTNTKIKDTYVGLLKTTDNQAIDAAGVTLVEDGAGNASALSVGRSGNGVTITGGLNATLSTAAQPNITSVGTLSSLTVSGDLTVDTSTLKVDSANNRVGIGTSSPNRTLNVLGTAAFSNSDDSGSIVFIPNNTTNRIYSREANDSGQDVPLAFMTGISERMRIDASGRVGINTTTLSSMLNVAGDSTTPALRVFNGGLISPITSFSAAAALQLISYQSEQGSPYTKTSAIIANADSTVPSEMQFWTKSNGSSSPAERMRIDSAGRVGIGTSSPNYQFHLQNSGQAVLAITGGTAANEYAQIFLGDSSGLAQGRIRYENFTDSLDFVVNNNPRMIINSSGNVGIGTSTIPSKLSLSASNAALASEGLVSLKANAAAQDNGAQITFGTTSARHAAVAGRQEGIGGSAGYLQFGTRASSGDITERMRIDSSGNVGIGTSSPSSNLEVSDSIGAVLTLHRADTVLGSGNNIGIINFNADVTGDTISAIKGKAEATGTTQCGITFETNDGSSTSEVMRLTSNKYLRMNSGTGGIQFGGDTAADNALDDYEEGTWTPAITFGGASVAVTYSEQSGQYTKVGRQVSVSGRIFLSNKGTSTGDAVITGLPFTSGNINSYASPSSFRINNISFADFLQGNVRVNNTEIAISEVTNAGVISNINDANFVNTSDIYFSATYFV